MNITSQRLAAWSGVLFIVLFAIGMVALAQFIPPPKANDTAQEVVDLYTENTDRLRAGLVCMMVAAGFLASWTAAIAVQLKRTEGDRSPMTYTQIATGAAGVLAVAFPVMIMIAASFRPERDPEITQTLNDLAWLPFIMLFSPVLVQTLSIGVAVFQAGDKSVYPRWVGYFNFWCALLFMPAVLIPFFKTGAFAWHGAMEFWLAATVFFGWVVVMTVVTLQAITKQQTKKK